MTLALFLSVALAKDCPPDKKHCGSKGSKSAPVVHVFNVDVLNIEKKTVTLEQGEERFLCKADPEEFELLEEDLKLSSSEASPDRDTWSFTYSFPGDREILSVSLWGCKRLH